MRRSTFLWCVLGISVVIGLFVIKHRVQELEDRLHTLNAEIITDQDATQVLQAEWSYLNQPTRLEALSKRLLGMELPDAEQTVTMEELLRKAEPEAGVGTDVAQKTAKLTPRPSKARQKTQEGWLSPILTKLRKSQ
jgi:cell division protein FtsL